MGDASWGVGIACSLVEKHKGYVGRVYYEKKGVRTTARVALERTRAHVPCEW